VGRQNSAGESNAACLEAESNSAIAQIQTLADRKDVPCKVSAAAKKTLRELAYLEKRAKP